MHCVCGLVSECTVFVVWFQNAQCLWFGFRMHNVFVVAFRIHNVCGMVLERTVTMCLCGFFQKCLWFGFRMHNVFMVWFQNAQCPGLVHSLWFQCAASGVPWLWPQ